MTTLVKWMPFQDLDVLERRMRRVLEDVGVVPEPLPAADLYETQDEVIVKLDVPGFEETELEIEVTDHTLVVKGERTEETEKKDKTFYLHERLEKHFERRFMLPTEADLAKAKASFGKGVLEVHVPKVEEPKARTIEIAKA
jgi:HSP20 family protein